MIETARFQFMYSLKSSIYHNPVSFTSPSLSANTLTPSPARRLHAAPHCHDNYVINVIATERPKPFWRYATSERTLRTLNILLQSGRQKSCVYPSRIPPWHRTNIIPRRHTLYENTFIPALLLFPSRWASAGRPGWWTRSQSGPASLCCGTPAAVWRRLALAPGTRVYSLFAPQKPRRYQRESVSDATLSADPQLIGVRGSRNRREDSSVCRFNGTCPPFLWATVRLVPLKTWRTCSHWRQGNPMSHRGTNSHTRETRKWAPQYRKRKFKINTVIFLI